VTHSDTTEIRLPVLLPLEGVRMAVGRN